ncbi:YaaC family protein [Oceanobacillus halotolerans]|uniref:YaaC family protein n=1 Tax=Oceanobacillus halotolerans TaxID=2663380 RepID=UPI0013CF707D|nr:YaaC family protein [Oceanobacillus halotolerans]
MKFQEINTFYTYLLSQSSAQYFLYSCYQQLGMKDAEIKSYENCSAFVHYLNHGRKFYENGRKSELLIQPILYFYGMVHLLKACLLTIRPNYPESTSLLAHGVSTRKRKRKNYSFIEDEVKIQHNGLFPYVNQHIYEQEKVPFEKIKMDYLFGLIPEMQILLSFHQREKMISVGKQHQSILRLPTQLLDHYHLTEKALIQRLKPYLSPIKKTTTEKEAVIVELTKSIESESNPFFFHMSNEMIYFPINRSYFIPISEVMVHYLLLYNLSMLCRYEAEWWGELITTKPEIDYAFISHFLAITAEKIPLLLGHKLYQNLQRN